MTTLITFPGDESGQTLYAQIIKEDGEIVIQSDLSSEVLVDANWGNYDFPLTEAGTASAVYQFTFPALPAGIYTIAVYAQAGGSPAVGDVPRVGAGLVDWDGTAIRVPLSSTQVQAAVNAALVALHLDHLLAADYDPASKPGVATALLNELIGDDEGVSQFTLNALELAPSGGEGLAAAVWEYAQRTLTQGAASVAAAVTGSDIAVYRGTTWIIALTGLGDIATYDKVYLSVKSSADNSDDKAILRVWNNASGLERFNKTAPVSAANGTITIDDAGAGNITITIQEEETINAPTSVYFYDVKGVDSDGNVDELSAGGRFTITGDVTRKIT